MKNYKVYPNVSVSKFETNMECTISPVYRAHYSHGPLFRPYESDLGLQGKRWGSLKCSIECLDCCHHGKDTAIKLSSEVTHRSARQDRPLTWYELVNKRTNSDSYYFQCHSHSYNCAQTRIPCQGGVRKICLSCTH